MKEFSVTLLREKVIISDHGAGGDRKPGTKTMASSNRMEAELYDPLHGARETFVVRCQNMHMGIRMFARIVQTYIKSGPIIHRPVPFDWEEAWKGVSNEYEEKFNPDLWVCIYHDGNILFRQGEHHPFLDAIEKYNMKIDSAYENAIPLAESALQNAGKNITLEQEGNLALTSRFEKDKGRCAIILRGPMKTTTFSFSIAAQGENKLNIPQTLMACAAFLEGVQLAFMVGTNDEKMKMEMLDPKSEAGKQTKEARRRIARLNTEIMSFERQFQVHYRPERPDFQQVTDEAGRIARRIFLQTAGS
ncbi:MAG: hypothetical protein ACT4OY_07675 [Alphaproteobacteria bacterium]